MSELAQDVLNSELAAYKALGKLVSLDDDSTIETEDAISFFTLLSDTTDSHAIAFREALLPSASITKYGKTVSDLAAAEKALDAVLGEGDDEAVGLAVEAVAEMLVLDCVKLITLLTHVR